MEDFEQIHFSSYVSNRTNQNKDYSQAFEQEVQQRGLGGDDGFMSQIGEPQAVARAKELVAPKQTITEEQLLHIENGEFAKQSKILHKFFEGEQFEGSDQEAVQYGLDVMGEFTFNFAGMPVTTLFQGESEANPGGTLAQAAALIFSGTKQDAKAFLHVMDRYDMLPNISQNGMKRMLRGLGNDPSVWGSIASGGVGLLAKKFGIDATKGTIRSQLTNLAAAPAKLAMEKPIATSAVVSGGITGVSDVATQGVEIAAGEEASPIDRVKRALFSTAIGTAAGAAIPTTLAAVGRPLADVAGQAARDATPLIGKTLDAIEGAGDAAKARMADADGSVTLGMNIDPDPAIAALGDAVKAARAKYEASPNDPNARREYLDARHKRDAELSSIPVEEKLKVDVNYRMMHQPTTPQDGAARLDDMTGGGTVFPDDVYGGDAVRLYGGNNPADQESASIIQSVRGNPEAEVTIYRGVPKDVDTINPGDWVTLSKRYADDHAESGYGQMGDEAGKVISQKVKVKDVYSDGNDLNEFGYFPEDIAETNVAKLEPPTETEPGIIAFHGSGKDFDEFLLKYIGTGEGAQAYGYGLYFTDSEDIARVYRDSIRAFQDMKGKIDATYKGKPFKDLGDTAAAEAAGPEYKAITGILERMNKGQSKDAAKKDIIKVIEGEIRNLPSDGDDELTGLLKSSLQSELDAIRSVDVNDIVQSKGKMYKVSLTPKPEDMIDYQTTFADQPKKIQDALKAVGYEVETNKVGMKVSPSEIRDAMRMPMSVIIDRLKKQIGPKELSEKLLEQGVPGIKYRAAGSRGANVDAADAEMNYVIFDDKMIKILEKYGIVGPVAITGVAATQQEGESDGNNT